MWAGFICACPNFHGTSRAPSTESQAVDSIMRISGEDAPATQWQPLCVPRRSSVASQLNAGLPDDSGTVVFHTKRRRAPVSWLISIANHAERASSVATIVVEERLTEKVDYRVHAVLAGSGLEAA